LALEFVDCEFQVTKQGSKSMFEGIKVCCCSEPRNPRNLIPHEN